MAEASVSARPEVTSTAHAPWMLRLALGVIACASVFPLLAWVYEVGAFDAWSALVASPLLLALVAAALVLARTRRWPSTRAAIVAGAMGGLIGTLGYDLFRVPFIIGGGFRLLAPIESYGVLLLARESSSPFTDFAGWAYHFTNGIGFGIAYAVVAAGRSWRWGIVWGLFLESAVVFSPFAQSYGLINDNGIHWAPIIIAYAAHVPYGIAVGVFAQHHERTARWGIDTLHAPVAAVLLVVVVGLVVWHQPYSRPDEIDRGRAVAAGPSAVIVDGVMHPAWLRIPVGGCAAVANEGPETAPLSTGQTLAVGESVELCNDEAGVHRVRVAEEPFSGGWLIVDWSLPTP